MNLEFKPNFAEAVERMRRLWDLEEPLDRVPALVGVPFKSSGKADGSYFGKLDLYLAEREPMYRHRAAVRDETIPEVDPQYGHALISALCGSPIRAESHTVWSVPILGDLDAVDELHLDWDNPWGCRAREDYERLLEWARGRCAVGDYEVEGVSDTMAALRGIQRLCFDFRDEPQAVDRFARKVTDLLIEFGRWNNTNVAGRQPLLGGMTSGWRLWMPLPGIVTTEDATVMFSPETYRRFIQPHDRRLSGAFRKALLEVHREGNHMISDFGEVESHSMLTIENPLRMRPEHLEMVRRLLGRRVLYIGVKRAEIEELLKFTGTRGVLIVTGAESPSQANDLLDELERLTEKHRGRAPAGA